MVNEDVQLIREILSGDDAAFSTLVQKYQKSVHAFAWRKIGDYHFAEEITQDTFIQVYKNLATLRNPNLFAGWLYVIANRLCIKWNQKRKSTFQSLEDTPMAEIDEYSYNKYTSEQREIQDFESRLERVKKLLEKLPESERTVITLYYLGEMTTREISKFLGVSVNTIKSRLRRARMRLQEENPQPQEIFSTVKFTTNLTESVMQEVADIKQTPAPIGKPSPPWWVFGSVAAILVMVFIGLSNQHLLRYQAPYSLDAQSEPKIEIVDASAVFDTDIKLSARNQLTRAVSVEIAQDETTTETKNKTPLNLDLNAILAGIKQNDEAAKSGEGRCVYTQERFSPLGDPIESMTWKARLVFDQHQNRVRMELNENVTPQQVVWPRRTIVVTETGTWDIVYIRIDHKPTYRFDTMTRLPLVWNYVAPRRWSRIHDAQDLPTSLKDFNYQVLTREMIDDMPCYVLGTKKEPPPTAKQQMPETSRIWIAPEHGFRFVKRELKLHRKTESLDGRLKKGSPIISRDTFSYQQIGDVWFLKSAKHENAWIDPEGKEHVYFRQTLELQDFKINHSIPSETFTVDIPDDAMISVEGLRERISKQEFLEWYEQE